MTKISAITLVLFLFSVHASSGATRAFQIQVDAGNSRLLDDRRGYIDDIPERNVNDDGGFIGDDITNDDGQVTTDDQVDDTATTDDKVDDQTTDDSPKTDDTTPNPCSENTDGSFGDTSSNAFQISYNYEMVTVANADIESTLTELESSISAAIASSGIITCVSRRNLRRKLAMTGLSSAPGDKVMTEDCSLAGDVNPDECSVIEGRLTVYADESSDEVNSQVKAVIKNGMESGSFASSSDDIIELIYFDPNSTVDPNDVVEPVSDDVTNRARGGINATPFIASGACAAALIGFIAGQRMLAKKKESDENEETEEPEA